MTSARGSLATFTLLFWKLEIDSVIELWYILDTEYCVAEFLNHNIQGLENALRQCEKLPKPYFASILWLFVTSRSKKFSTPKANPQKQGDHNEFSVSVSGP